MVYIPYPPGTAVDEIFPVLHGATAIELNRNLTHWFIMMDPVDVTLIPRVRARTASGGYTWTEGPARPLQTFKFIYGGNTGAGRAGIVETGDGRNRQFTYVMLGDYDAEVGILDRFVDHKGQWWEVEELLPYNEYEVRALVRSYGGDPQYG